MTHTHDQNCRCCEDAEPLTLARVEKIAGLSALLHRSREHGWARVMLESSLARASANDDTPKEDHLALALVELLGYLGTTLSYYQDAFANEAYLGTARRRVSVRRHASLVQYELRSGLMMSTQVAFELERDDRTPEMMTVPAGTRIQSSGPAHPAGTFQTLEEIVCRQAWNALRPRRSRSDTSTGGDGVTLDTKVDPLPGGRLMLLTGIDAVTGDEVAEVAILETTVDDDDSSKLYFASPLHHRYTNDTLVLHGNVAPATYGQTVVEVLGDGEDPLTRALFPLTYVPLASDGEIVIDVRVDGLRWKEVPSLLDSGPHDQVYVVEVADDGKTTIAFGDGKMGASPSAGARNITATYRTGIGAEGDVGATEILNPNPTELSVDPPEPPHL